MKEACESCRFWLADPVEGGVGRCRRFPPSPVVEGRLCVSTLFPLVGSGNWCGEYQSRKESP